MLRSGGGWGTRGEFAAFSALFQATTQNEQASILPGIEWVWNTGARPPTEPIRLVVIAGSIAVVGAPWTIDCLLLWKSHRCSYSFWQPVSRVRDTWTRARPRLFGDPEARLASPFCGPGLRLTRLSRARATQR